MAATSGTEDTAVARPPAIRYLERRCDEEPWTVRVLPGRPSAGADAAGPQRRRDGSSAGLARSRALRRKPLARVSRPARSRNCSGPTTAAPVMVVNFMGLTGPAGVLPLYYTELIARAHPRRKIATLLDFFDIFNHRMISLFYQAWEKYRVHVAYERGERRPLLASPAGL